MNKKLRVSAVMYLDMKDNETDDEAEERLLNILSKYVNVYALNDTSEVIEEEV